VGICVIVCVQKSSHHFLQTFGPLRMFKIVFRDSSLYRKQLSMFCLLWLSSTNSKTAVVNITALRHLITSQQGKRKTKNLLDFYITKTWKFTCVLHAVAVLRGAWVGHVQGRRQDLAAGGSKTRRRGQKPEGGHILKILY